MGIEQYYRIHALEHYKRNRDYIALPERSYKLGNVIIGTASALSIAILIAGLILEIPRPEPATILCTQGTAVIVLSTRYVYKAVIVKGSNSIDAILTPSQKFVAKKHKYSYTINDTRHSGCDILRGAAKVYIISKLK